MNEHERRYNRNVNITFALLAISMIAALIARIADLFC